MLENHQIHIIFFLGIGGIGMSALARYYNGRNVNGEGMKVRVCGYDRTPSALTHELEQEGIQITYTDDPAILREWGLQPEHTMVVRTPAVPADSAIYTWLRGEGFETYAFDFVSEWMHGVRRREFQPTPRAAP